MTRGLPLQIETAEVQEARRFVRVYEVYERDGAGYRRSIYDRHWNRLGEPSEPAYTILHWDDAEWVGRAKIGP